MGCDKKELLLNNLDKRDSINIIIKEDKDGDIIYTAELKGMGIKYSSKAKCKESAIDSVLNHINLHLKELQKLKADVIADLNNK